MSLRHSYTLFAPLYDALLARASHPLRAASLAHLPRQGPLDVLLAGVGTGLDLPHLPPAHRYTGLDLTAAMLRRARPRRGALDLALVQGDCQAMPFPDARFDAVVAHLIVAVTPAPARTLAEIGRVLRPGGRVLLLDKFLRPGQQAPLRRALNPLSRRLATRLDVVFEEVLARVPELALEDDRPLLLGGWFRAIRLVKSRP